MVRVLLGVGERRKERKCVKILDKRNLGWYLQFFENISVEVNILVDVSAVQFRF